MNGQKSQSRKQPARRCYRRERSPPPHQLRHTKTDPDNIIAGITSAAEKVCK